MDWLRENAPVVQAVVSVLTAVVWLAYLQLFFSNIRRQRRPEILIAMGEGGGLDTRCLVSNLGLAPIYVLGVVMTVRGGGETRQGLISRAPDRDPRDDDRAAPALFDQGPVKSGEMFAMGSFRHLAEEAGWRRAPDAIERLEVKVVAIEAASDALIGARRAFGAQRGGGPGDGGLVLRPETIVPEQIRSPLARRRLRREWQAWF